MPAFRLDRNAQMQLSPQIFNMIRGLAIDNARAKVEIAQVPDLTDNSTGTAGTSIASMALQTSAFDATASGGADLTTFNAALVKVHNAQRILVNSMNNVRARLGLPIMTLVGGVQAAADTIPALDKTVSSASGTSAVDFTTGKAAMNVVRLNMNKLYEGLHDVMRAIGETNIANLDQGQGASGITQLNLATVPAATASASGASAISKASADAFFTAVANNIATIANQWNGKMFQTGLTDLTDSSGGTPAQTNLAAAALPAPANGAATTSAPKAGFDTVLGVIANAQATIAKQLNSLLVRYGVTPITDNTGGTATTTVAAITNNLTAVDGSSGTVAVDQVSGRDRMTKVTQNNATLANYINQLAPLFGIEPITDQSGATPIGSLNALPATATGVGGASGTPTLLDADVDTWLGITRNNIATLASKLNAMTGTGVPSKGLNVVSATIFTTPS